VFYISLPLCSVLLLIIALIITSNLLDQIYTNSQWFHSDISWDLAILDRQNLKILVSLVSIVGSLVKYICVSWQGFVCPLRCSSILIHKIEHVPSEILWIISEWLRFCDFLRVAAYFGAEFAIVCVLIWVCWFYDNAIIAQIRAKLLLLFASNLDKFADFDQEIPQ
jgi:hypothetical protein